MKHYQELLCTVHREINYLVLTCKMFNQKTHFPKSVHFNSSFLLENSPKKCTKKLVCSNPAANIFLYNYTPSALKIIFYRKGSSFLYRPL